MPREKDKDPNPWGHILASNDVFDQLPDKRAKVPGSDAVESFHLANQLQEEIIGEWTKEALDRTLRFPKRQRER